MAKIYLVDSENIGASWSQLLASMSDEDKMYVFYTDKSPYISYDNLLQVIAHCNIPVFIKCFEGKNALDFQLVSELGFKLCQDPEAEFIIISDDYGYDAAVRYWTGRKYNVRRMGKKYCRPMLPRRNEETPVVQSEVVAVQVATEQPEKQTAHQAEEQPVKEAELQVEEMFVKETEQQMEEQPVQEAEPQVEAPPMQEVELQVEQLPVQEVELQVEQPVKDAALQPEEQPVIEAEPQREEQPEMMTEPAAQEEPDRQSDVPVQQEAQAPNSLKDNQTQKRTRDRRRKHRKETVRESEIAEEKTTEEGNTAVVGETEGTVNTAVDEAEKAEEQNPLDEQILSIVNNCNSPEPEKDAHCVKELFRTLPMSNLTTVNTALKMLIGNELGNDIYRELKDHQECRAQMDALYYPTMKERFIHYVQIVLDRSELADLTAEEIGNFLLRIPRKNLNSIRAAMLKEYDHELGSAVYTVFKPHIKVLNKI